MPAYIHTQVRVDAYMNAYIHAYARGCVLMYVYVCMHVNMHVFMHIHTCRHSCRFMHCCGVMMSLKTRIYRESAGFSLYIYREKLYLYTVYISICIEVCCSVSGNFTIYI